MHKVLTVLKNRNIDDLIILKLEVYTAKGSNLTISLFPFTKGSRRKQFSLVDPNSSSEFIPKLI